LETQIVALGREADRRAGDRRREAGDRRTGEQETGARRNKTAAVKTSTNLICCNDDAAGILYFCSFKQFQAATEKQKSSV